MIDWLGERRLLLNFSHSHSVDIIMVQFLVIQHVAEFLSWRSSLCDNPNDDDDDCCEICKTLSAICSNMSINGL